MALFSTIGNEPGFVWDGNTQLYKQSILFELWHNDAIQQSFIMPVPPEGIQIQQGYRKTITQVFGGAIIDSMGLGLGSLTITGNTGSLSQFRNLVVGPYKKIEKMNSAQAIEKFLKDIIRYPINTKTKGFFGEIECRIYDLTDNPNAGIPEKSPKTYPKA